MKSEELNLTIDELDKLCHLYMDCKLSVLEEKELEYVLTQSELTSPSIDEVRSLMNIQQLPSSSKLPVRKRTWNWRYISGIAVSLAILFGIGFTVLKTDNSDTSVPDNCIAYVNGREIHGDVAMARIESETRKADEFISRMAELEEEEQNKIEFFMNHQYDIK